MGQRCVRSHRGKSSGQAAVASVGQWWALRQDGSGRADCDGPCKMH